MERVLVDTDVCSYLFKGDSRALPYISYLADKVICISFQTEAELFQWARARNWSEVKLDELVRWMGSLIIISPDEETDRIWASIRVARRKAGRPIAPQDAWIAACALRHRYPLVTHNPRDFEGVDGLTVVSFGT